MAAMPDALSGTEPGLALRVGLLVGAAVVIVLAVAFRDLIAADLREWTERRSRKEEVSRSD